MSSQRSHGFSLLEVMIAMAILAVSLTALFSSEAGAVQMAYRARRIGLATQLVRCKMNEVEEQLALEGLPAISEVGSDECCEDAEIDGFNCDWEVERIVLPETMFAPEEGEDGADALGALAGPTEDPKSRLEGLVGADPSAVLAEGDNAAMDGMAGMAMGYVFPILKPFFEEQIRRVTVTVHWQEGTRPMSFDVTQYVVAEQPSQQPGAIPGAAQPGGTQPGSPPSSQGVPQ